MGAPSYHPFQKRSFHQKNRPAIGDPAFPFSSSNPGPTVVVSCTCLVPLPFLG